MDTHSSLRGAPDAVRGNDAIQSGCARRPWIAAPFGLAMTMLLSACSPEAAEKSPAATEEAKEAPTRSASGNELIECAIGGAQWFLRECEVEKGTAEDGARILIVRHPDGGFRRFTVLTDGRGLEPADGAEQGETALVDGRLDVRVADDRYRFPATVKPDAQAQ